MIDAEQIRNKCKKEIEALHLARVEEDAVIRELSMLADLVVEIYINRKNNKSIC